MHSTANIARLATGMKNEITSHRGKPAERILRIVIAVPIQMNGSARISIARA